MPLKLLSYEIIEGIPVARWCETDTHRDTPILFEYETMKEMFDNLIIEGETLEEILRNSYIEMH